MILGKLEKSLQTTNSTRVIYITCKFSPLIPSYYALQSQPPLDPSAKLAVKLCSKCKCTLGFLTRTRALPQARDCSVRLSSPSSVKKKAKEGKRRGVSTREP